LQKGRKVWKEEKDMKEKYLYIVLMSNVKSISREVVYEHVEYLKKLEKDEKLLLCGPCVDYEGGVVILKVKDLKEAHSLAKEDPFIADGYKSYEIRTMEWAHRENNYGLNESNTTN
jgi:uncharacterized protein YciI